MLKFYAYDKNGKTIVGLALEPRNMELLAAGKPIPVNLEEVGIEGVDILICFTPNKDELVAELRKQFGNVNEIIKETPDGNGTD